MHDLVPVRPHQRGTGTSPVTGRSAGLEVAMRWVWEVLRASPGVANCLGCLCGPFVGRCAERVPGVVVAAHALGQAAVTQRDVPEEGEADSFHVLLNARAERRTGLAGRPAQAGG